MANKIEIRRLGLDDIDMLIDIRMEVLVCVFGLNKQSMPISLRQSNLDYYLKHLKDDTHIALAAYIDGAFAGCGALCITDEMPSPDNPSGKCGYIMNVYTRPNFRDCGLAHAIVSSILQECRNRDITKVTLETTDAGRKLYESFDFRPYYDILKWHNS